MTALPDYQMIGDVKRDNVWIVAHIEGQPLDW
jgi:hypothetical protein